MAKTSSKPLSNIKKVSGDTSWKAEGNCSDQDPNLFFEKSAAGIKAAKDICAGCVVREECLEYSLENRIDHGVWGGASEKDRRNIRKAAKLAKVVLRVGDN